MQLEGPVPEAPPPTRPASLGGDALPAAEVAPSANAGGSVLGGSFWGFGKKEEDKPSEPKSELLEAERPRFERL